MLLTTGCSQFALVASGTSIVVSQNAYSKIYSGVDVLTIINTEKDIKTHTINKVKKIMNK